MADDRNSWHDAVIDELVSCGIYSEAHDSNPRKAVQDLIDWNVQVALDPAVSKEARELRDAGFKEVGVIRSKSLAEVRFHGEPPDAGVPVFIRD